MNNNLGLIGYMFLTTGICFEIIKGEYQTIVQLFGYVLIMYNLYLKNKEKEEHKKEDIEIGHFILFVYYFYSLFFSDEKIYFVTFLTLFAHFILMKENNKIIKLGYILSVIYYLMKLGYYINDSNYVVKIKIIAYTLLMLFYVNKSVY